jgi:hypothetical protein
VNIAISHQCVEEKKAIEIVCQTPQKKGNSDELPFLYINLDYRELISSLIALYSSEPVLPKRTYISRTD